MNKERLQSNLKSARKSAKLTQSALGMTMGIAGECIHQWETGARTPKMETIEKIAAACGIHPNELFVGVWDKEEVR